MLVSWTGIDLETLVGDKINEPENAIFMNATDHEHFGRFRFYFDKEAVSPVRLCDK